MKLSVIMATYNGAKTIRLSIDSLLNQTFKDFELIICDDASTDNTFEIISEYQKKYPRITVLHNETNLRAGASRNRCIERAKGEYIAILDDDDLALPHRFATQIDFLDSHPEYALTGSNVYYFETNDLRVWGTTTFEGEQSSLAVLKGFAFVNPSTMFRASVLKEVGGHTVSKITRRTEDYDLFCKLYAAGFKGYNIKEVLLLYREDSQTIQRRKFKHRVDYVRLRLFWRKKLNLRGSSLLTTFIPLIAWLVPQPLLLLRRKRKNRVFMENFTDNPHELLQRKNV